MKQIKRPIYLKKLIDSKNNGEIKIITGIRRCGKSYLLFNIFNKYLIDNGVKEKNIIKKVFCKIFDKIKEKNMVKKQIQKCNSDIIISTNLKYNNFINKYCKENTVKIFWEHTDPENNKKYINKAPLLLDFELEQVLKEYKNDFSPTDKLKLIKKIMPLVEEIPNNIIQNEYIRLVADRINVDEQSLIREVNRSKTYIPVINKEFSQIVTKTSNICEKAQKNLLSLFLITGSNSDINNLIEITRNVKFTDENLKNIYLTIDKLSYQLNNKVENLIQALYKEFAEDNELKEIITDLIYIADSFKNLSEKDFKTVVHENIAKIQQYQADCEKRELVSKYKNLNDDDIESMQFQMQLREKIRNKQTIGE